MPYSPSDPRPEPPLSRTTMVIGLYGAMALVALLIGAARGNPDLVRLDVGASGWWLLGGAAIGLGIGIVVVGLTRIAVARFEWARALRESFRELLGPLTMKEIVTLAVASSIGEELLFRGALLPWLGVWLQAAVFALLHIGPGRRFLPWTVSALVLGIGFGLVAIWTGNIVGPIAAHLTINFLNLRLIVRRA